MQENVAATALNALKAPASAPDRVLSVKNEANLLRIAHSSQLFPHNEGFEPY